MVRELILSTTTPSTRMKAVCEKWNNGAQCKDIQCPRYHPKECHTSLDNYLKEKGIAKNTFGNNPTGVLNLVIGGPQGASWKEEERKDSADSFISAYNPNWYRLKSE